MKQGVFQPNASKEKHMTWGDKIRSMTDQELAEFLWSVWKNEDPFYKECVDGWLVPFYHWLKKEVSANG